MAYTAKELVNIAVAEIGYKEKDSDKELDSKEGNAGSGNHTKYARDLYEAGYYNGNKCGYAWCDVFVDWCFYQLTGKDKEKAEAIECQTGDCGAGCEYSKQYYQQQGRFDTTPKAGDQIFFITDGRTSHTGIVEKVEGSTITTVEGNSDNQVRENSYSLTSSRIEGYGHPKYDEESASGSESTTSSGSKSSSSTTAKLNVDGSLGPKTVTRWQEVMGQTGSNVDGFIDGQDSGQKKYWEAVSSGVCKWSGGSSAVVKKWQNYLINKGYSCGSSGADGKLGKNTALASQKFLIAKGYSCGSKGADGYFGANSTKAFQNWLNDQK